ncbi:MAG: pyrophosphate--fructose-6-phosphate 1-phosphotransferase [Puniceicoccales bacterium]|jgi:pyrophosphate--fructose-6-phosphate 1-phosphotransferase|nr:pyrophosphate--fructose-6-phosphate 1-phosphotransferase [Puniceicoccales bacterium]
MDKVGILTAGGLAPCLSAAVGEFILQYTKKSPETEIIAYRYGYQGLLLGESFVVTPEVRRQAQRLLAFGGSPLGNSRVKLTNGEDCVKRGLVKAGEDPQKVAADQLVQDGVTVLHTIGGDDTNTAAGDLACYLREHHYDLTVVGLPKTVDNDVYPIAQSLGAVTAAEAGAIFFEHIVSEASASPRMLIVHEVMGRHCGWLTAATALAYRRRLEESGWVPDIGLRQESRELHAIYIPERALDIEGEASRLAEVMERVGNVNVFISEGAGVETIVREMDLRGETVERDAFGHVRLDKIQSGQYLASRLGKQLGAEKVLVQKSGYFARSSAANTEDLHLIRESVASAIEAASRRCSGVVGYDEERGKTLGCIDFTRVRGGKPYDFHSDDFQSLLRTMAQS